MTALSVANPVTQASSMSRDHCFLRQPPPDFSQIAKKNIFQQRQEPIPLPERITSCLCTSVEHCFQPCSHCLPQRTGIYLHLKLLYNYLQPQEQAPGVVSSRKLEHDISRGIISLPTCVADFATPHTGHQTSQGDVSGFTFQLWEVCTVTPGKKNHSIFLIQ